MANGVAILVGEAFTNPRNLDLHGDSRPFESTIGNLEDIILWQRGH